MHFQSHYGDFVNVFLLRRRSFWYLSIYAWHTDTWHCK